MLRQEFLNAVKLYNTHHSLNLWQEVEAQHNHPSRHYHTLDHLESLFAELNPVRGTFREWNVVVFAIAYHDIVYKPSKSNNEEKSAELAETRLEEIGADAMIARCKQFILATKRHEPRDEEIDLFTDADLSVLGAEPAAYDLYTKQVRKEYSIYPDLLYKPGRKKVLLHFLGMKHIYKSSYFREKYEAQARANMHSELTKL